jgi:hypothetical protein
MQHRGKVHSVLTALMVAFLVLTMAFAFGPWDRPAPLPPIPLVEASVTNTATVRTNLAELMRRGADLSDFDCYGCHDKKKPPQLRFDAHHNLVVPEEHSDIVMGHGRHNRNNLCYNCHDEANLEGLQTRDGRELKLSESTPLCGSCHGPTYRDWEAGVHGRISGYWNRQLGPIVRQDCVSCHNPHSPAFPGRKPAPGPHPLRPVSRPMIAQERSPDHG